MIVPSLQFLAFALCAALVFNVSTRVYWRQAVLLVVNFLFLLSFSRVPSAFIPFAAFLGWGFLVLRTTRDRPASHLFVVMLISVVVVFLWLKRYSFIPHAAFLRFPYLTIGLSYVFFRMLHLIIDNHQGAVETKVSGLSFINYSLNFTSLTSGPIQRYEDYRRMELECLPLNLAVVGVALERVILGYFKVAVVSMLLSLFHQQVIAALVVDQTLWGRTLNAALIASIYPVYLYFNFSGYVDVVIGVARLFRIELPENFDRPFSSQNFIAFWSRWHITLSNWLKTYVYNPLMMAGMSRIQSPALAPYVSVFAFFVTFFLVGLWHGPTTEFIFFGVLQGGGVAANKLYQITVQNLLGRKEYRALSGNPYYQALCRGLTFSWFAFTLFWFWSTWSQIAGIYRSAGVLAATLSWLVIVAASTFALALMEIVHRSTPTYTWQGAPIVESRYVRTAWTTVLAVVVLGITVLLDSPAPDIVYKTF